LTADVLACKHVLQPPQEEFRSKATCDVTISGGCVSFFGHCPNEYPDDWAYQDTFYIQCSRSGIPKQFADLALARGDGRYARLLRALGGVRLLIIDDWDLEPLDAAARHDLLEILEERYGRRSTIITSQIPLNKWHELIGDSHLCQCYPRLHR
jgi:IstB-like ATP binding protein